MSVETLAPGGWIVGALERLAKDGTKYEIKRCANPKQRWMLKVAGSPLEPLRLYQSRGLALTAADERVLEHGGWWNP